MAEDDVHRPGCRVQEVDERHRRRDRRCERREIEDRSEEADAAPGARHHHRDAEREQHLQRDHDQDQPERVPYRRPDLGVLREQIVVVRPADPLRRRQQVVVRERQIDAHHERVAEEQAEPDQPGGHQQQDEAAAAPGRPPPRPLTLSSESASSHCHFCHGTPPAWACFNWASTGVARLPLDGERLDQRAVRVARGGDRRGLRVRVGEDVQERLEPRIRLDLLRVERLLRRRHVPDRVREQCERMGFERQVLEQRPCLVLVLHALRDPDDRPVDVPGPVEARFRVVHRSRSGGVAELRMLGLDERDTPLAVDHHAELADLERM